MEKIVSKKVLQSRKVSRTAFTRHYNLLGKYLNENNFIEAKAVFIMLEKEFSKLQEKDSEILEEMLDKDFTDTDLDNEKESTYEYEMKFELIQQKILKMDSKNENKLDDLGLNQNEENNSIMNVSSDYKHLRLPPVSIESFDGELKNWLPFWGQFENIHNDENVPVFHKFRILNQSMKPGSRAKQVVDCFPISKDMKNYDVAIEALKERFGREDLLIEVYIRELLEMIIHTSRTSQLSLVEMYDKIECQMRYLEILGVTSGKSAAILCPLLESCMSEDFLRVWQRSYCSGTIKDAEERLAKFREFIKSEVQNEQRISLAMSKFGISSKPDSKVIQKRDTKNKISTNVPTAMGLFTGNGNEYKKPTCIFCDQSHNSTDCFKARDMLLDDKLKKVRDLKCCYLCLKKSHSSKQCKIKTSCPICDRKHALILCPNYCRTKTQSVQDRSKAELGANLKNAPVNVSTSKCDDSVLLPTLQVQLNNEQGQSCLVRAVIDTAAQRSYILNSTAEKMCLKSSGEDVLYHSLFGGKQTSKSVYKKFQVTLSSVTGDYKCKVEFLGQNVICGDLPSIPKGPWVKEIIAAGINFVDLSKDKGPIELLLGADVAGLFFMGNVRKLSTGTLVCFETCFGWTVSGRLPSKTTCVSKRETSAHLTTSMLCSTLSVSDLWRLDLIGIDEPTEHKHKDSIKADVKNYFLETVKINEEGRYEVNLPWKENHMPLPTNFELAVKRLDSTFKKLESDGHLSEYQNVFDEWKNEGVIEETTQSNEGHFIPHRHIVKQNSTTKIRPVFDASAHQKNAPSLNHMLEKGCNLIEQIPSLLHSFRMHRIGVVADIRRAFLQISITPSDRKFLKFLWYDSDKKIIVFQHNRVMFGLTSSPFLLAAVIDYHLDKTKEEVVQGKGNYCLDVIDTLKTCFYVDNVVHSVDSESALQVFERDATAIMAEGKFDLRGWECTDKQSNPPVLTPVLGMHWNRCTDTLEINLENLELCPENITKRTIMSAAHKIFDPLGIVSPVTICPKLLMKELWSLKADWDEVVPEQIKSKFLKWFEELKYLKNIKIPRWLFTSSVNHISIHTFTDASQLSYATVIFVRVQSEFSVKIQLIQSKSRISPVKRVTIPRLELLAANIGARLFSTVISYFDVKSENIYFWSDSTTVIAWIQRQENWGVFVSNRVNEIRKLTDSNRWFHIPGVMNPADLPSRGCLGKTLMESAWWEGPEWLYLPASGWPSSTSCDFNEEEILSETKKTISTLVTNKINATDSDWYCRYFSSYHKCVRMFAWIQRFLNNCRRTEKIRGVLTLEEITTAELQVLKLVQREAFKGVQDKKIVSLRPFEDESGVIRLQTKISNKPDSYDFRFPILLPKDHPLVMRLIHGIHIKECHVGVQGLLSIIREKYWVIGGRRAIKSVISKCVVCRKHECKHLETPTPSLPLDRVRTASAFEVIGVDLAGPLYLKNNMKTWICLFTCGVIRAVHLELLPSLSTEDFILGLRRFVARRGRPKMVYCDQGTNFRGAANLFKKIDFDKVLEYSEVLEIIWKFNPPASPWWGGWWERLIGLTKRLLRKVLGKSNLTYIEMETVLCDCESVLNSRPLTFMSEGSSEAYPITPSLFIQDIKEAGLPELDVVESKSLEKKWLHRHKLKLNFRKRFRNEYLGMLNTRSKKCKETPIKVGDVVLVGSDNQKRLDWPLARIIELIPGRDGVTRVVRLKTSSGEIVRPIQRIYPLLEGQETK